MRDDSVPLLTAFILSVTLWINPTLPSGEVNAISSQGESEHILHVKILLSLMCSERRQNGVAGGGWWCKVGPVESNHPLETERHNFNQKHNLLNVCPIIPIILHMKY